MREFEDEVNETKTMKFDWEEQKTYRETETMPNNKPSSSRYLIVG